MLNPYLALRSWSFKNVGDVSWDEHTTVGERPTGHDSGGARRAVYKKTSSESWFSAETNYSPFFC